MIVRFTQPVDFLNELKDKVGNLTAVNIRRLEDGIDPIESPLEVVVVRAEEQDEEDVTGEPILAGWELIRVDDRDMVLQLNFTDPISVSRGDLED